MSEGVAWAAGIFDGEGSVYLRKVGRYPRHGAMLTVEMADEKTIRQLWSVLPYGEVTGPRDVKSIAWGFGNRAPLWRWRVGRLEEVMYVCQVLLPHSVTKHESLLAALKSCESLTRIA